MSHTLNDRHEEKKTHGIAAAFMTLICFGHAETPLFQIILITTYSAVSKKCLHMLGDFSARVGP